MKWGIHFDLANKEKRIEELEREMAAPNFWDDTETSQKKMKELKSYKDDVEVYRQLEEELNSLKESYEQLRIKTLLSGEYDHNDAILSLHAGAGGTESCDWAAMLFRMYSRWASDKGYQLEVLDSLDGDEAGIKSITFQISGENAYGYLKSEKGVHRLVRISPFNAADFLCFLRCNAGYRG